jgi:hypothetical protein
MVTASLKAYIAASVAFVTFWAAALTAAVCLLQYTANIG